MMKFLLPCLCSFVGCYGYCIRFQIRNRKHMIFFASLCGMVEWGVFLAFGFLNNDVSQSFAASLAATMYSEIMARFLKTPATVFLLVGLIPLVPGGGIYYTMVHCINGDTMLFLESFIHTLGLAGAIALGILLGSTIMRLLHGFFKTRR